MGQVRSAAVQGAPIVASPDLTDDQLYCKFADDDLRPAGNVEALRNHPNPNVAKLAPDGCVPPASHLEGGAVPMEAVKAAAETDYNMAEQRNLEMKGQIEMLMGRPAADAGDGEADDGAGGTGGIAEAER